MGEAFSDPTQIFFFLILQSNTKKLYRQLSQETPLSPIPASRYVIAGSQHFESHFWIFFFFKRFICQKMQGFSNGVYVTWSTPTLHVNIGRHPSGHLEEPIRMGMTIRGLVGSGSSLSFRDGAEGRNSGSRVWQRGLPAAQLTKCQDPHPKHHRSHPPFSPAPGLFCSPQSQPPTGPESTEMQVSPTSQAWWQPWVLLVLRTRPTPLS